MLTVRKGNIVVMPDTVSGSIPYSITLKAIESIVTCLKEDFNQQGVRINAVDPEEIHTDIHSTRFDGKLAPLLDQGMK